MAISIRILSPHEGLSRPSGIEGRRLQLQSLIGRDPKRRQNPSRIHCPKGIESRWVLNRAQFHQITRRQRMPQHAAHRVKNLVPLCLRHTD
jgi:hypothetical protein